SLSDSAGTTLTLQGRLIPAPELSTSWTAPPPPVARRHPSVAGKAIELSFDNAVAGTGGAFESGPVGDGDDAAAIPDEAGFLQPAGDLRHGGPAHSQHLGQELLREREFVATY